MKCNQTSCATPMWLGLSWFEHDHQANVLFVWSERKHDIKVYSFTAVQSVCIKWYIFHETTYDSLLMTNLYWFRQLLGTKGAKPSPE